MGIYALADLHLSSAVSKPMDVFGEEWVRHTEKIHTAWQTSIGQDDLVLLPGDISWAMTLEEAKPDLDWIAELPGTKLMIRGNHDYWWNGIQKVRSTLHPSLHAIQNDAFVYGNHVICGTRGWLLPSHPKFAHEDDVVYRREGERLRLGLETAHKTSLPIIVMLHYPPCSTLGENTLFTDLLEEYDVKICVYGHLHGPAHRFAVEGRQNGITYRLVSADFVHFQPVMLISP